MLTIIVALVPTEDKNDDEKGIFYEDLQKYTQDVALHSVVILSGDLNARIGFDRHTTYRQAIGKFTYCDKTDENGGRLVNYCEACDIRSTQTRFPQPKSKSWTWLRPTDNFQAQLDHILINGKWLDSIRNVRAYNSRMNSDHRIQWCFLFQYEFREQKLNLISN